jgi:cytochrome c oxidase cbb3-type subunit III
MKRLAIVCMLACLVLGSACEREARRFVKPLVQPDPRAQATGDPPLQPGEKGAGMVAAASAGGYSQANAYDVQQGKQWFRWYNCVGCHSHGGGGMGPPLMDSSWIYGSDPDSVFATIMQGRPNGMPSFRGRIPEGQAWQLVAYVRSMSGLGSKQAAPSRADAMEGAPPENRRKPTPPDTEGGK